MISHLSLVICHLLNKEGALTKSGFENLQVYQLAERLADDIWNVTAKWDSFAKDTVGKQIVRAADSVGANIAEGSGRGSYQDNRRFVRMARGSLYETIHWLRRAYIRELLSKQQTQNIRAIISELSPKLNAYVRSIQERMTTNKAQSTKHKVQSTKHKLLTKNERSNQTH